MKRALLLMLCLSGLGCDQSATTQQQPMTAAAGGGAGTVTDTIDVGNYTYIHLDEQGKEIWLASNPITVRKGEQVRYSNAAVMKDFHSKKLDRTFDEILFVSDIQIMGPDGAVAGGAAAVAAQPQGGEAAADLAANPHAKVHAQAAKVAEPVAVQPLEGGRTIAGIMADRKKLEGQEVSLRAEVVKISPNIMGKNWMTLKDGTGTPPDDSLMMTTTWTASVGDVSVVRGRLRNDVDIGAGYTYKVLLEDARFLKDD